MFIVHILHNFIVKLVVIIKNSNNYVHRSVKTRYWTTTEQQTFFFVCLNPLLFVSCIHTFSKWCKITRGMKRSAQ
jgi:hypothetical protein